MNDKVTLDFKIIINVEVKSVFSFVSDLKNAPLWNSAVKNVEKYSNKANIIGSTYSMIREIFQGKVTNDIIVLDYQENKLFIINTLDGPTPFKYSYFFTQENNGTKLELKAEIYETGFPSSISPISSRFIHNGIKANLNSLKAILEAKNT